MEKPAAVPAEASTPEPSKKLSAQIDYFGFEDTHRFVLPDGESYIDHKTLTEGDRRKYLQATQTDLRIDSNTRDAHYSLAAGERIELLKVAITGWNLVNGEGNPVTFTKGSLQQFVSSANPKIVDLIEADIRKHNPWLLDDLSVEDIETEIARLEGVLEIKREEEAGKDG